MKSLCVLVFSLLCFIQAQAQNDFTGIYSFSYPLRGIEGYSIKPTKEDGGPSGEIILAKKSETLYAFWLSANRGWPNYNNGFVTGEINVVNGKAIYKQKSDYSTDSCILLFSLKPNAVKIDNTQTMGCDFGMGVSADGDYKKSKKLLTSEYLFSFMQGMGDVKSIRSDKAIIYKDASLSLPTKQYFIKGDKVYITTRSNKGIFVEYIAKGQRYVYGWISDEDI